jgi:hypothetical protein
VLEEAERKRSAMHAVAPLHPPRTHAYGNALRGGVLFLSTLLALVAAVAISTAGKTRDTLVSANELRAANDLRSALDHFIQTQQLAGVGSPKQGRKARQAALAESMPGLEPPATSNDAKSVAAAAAAVAAAATAHVNKADAAHAALAPHLPGFVVATTDDATPVSTARTMVKDERAMMAALSSALKSVSASPLTSLASKPVVAHAKVLQDSPLSKLDMADEGDKDLSVASTIKEAVEDKSSEGANLTSSEPPWASPSEIKAVEQVQEAVKAAADAEIDEAVATSKKAAASSYHQSRNHFMDKEAQNPLLGPYVYSASVLCGCVKHVCDVCPCGGMRESWRLLLPVMPICSRACLPTQNEIYDSAPFYAALKNASGKAAVGGVEALMQVPLTMIDKHEALVRLPPHPRPGQVFTIQVPAAAGAPAGGAAAAADEEGKSTHKQARERKSTGAAGHAASSKQEQQQREQLARAAVSEAASGGEGKGGGGGQGSASDLAASLEAKFMADKQRLERRDQDDVVDDEEQQVAQQARRAHAPPAHPRAIAKAAAKAVVVAAAAGTGAAAFFKEKQALERGGGVSKRGQLHMRARNSKDTKTLQAVASATAGLEKESELLKDGKQLEERVAAAQQDWKALEAHDKDEHGTSTHPLQALNNKQETKTARGRPNKQKDKAVRGKSGAQEKADGKQGLRGSEDGLSKAGVKGAVKEVEIDKEDTSSRIVKHNKQAKHRNKAVASGTQKATEQDGDAAAAQTLHKLRAQTRKKAEEEAKEEGDEDGDVAAGGGRSSGIKDEEAVDMRGEDEHMRGMSKFGGGGGEGRQADWSQIHVAGQWHGAGGVGRFTNGYSMHAGGGVPRLGRKGAGTYYAVTIPEGLVPGAKFLANIPNGPQMLVTVPLGVRGVAGSVVAVHVPAASMPQEDKKAMTSNARQQQALAPGRTTSLLQNKENWIEEEIIEERERAESIEQSDKAKIKAITAQIAANQRARAAAAAKQAEQALKAKPAGAAAQAAPVAASTRVAAQGRHEQSGGVEALEHKILIDESALLANRERKWHGEAAAHSTQRAAPAPPDAAAASSSAQELSLTREEMAFKRGLTREKRFYDKMDTVADPKHMRYTGGSYSAQKSGVGFVSRPPTPPPALEQVQAPHKKSQFEQYLIQKKMTLRAIDDIANPAHVHFV